MGYGIWDMGRNTYTAPIIEYEMKSEAGPDLAREVPEPMIRPVPAIWVSGGSHHVIFDSSKTDPAPLDYCDDLAVG